MKILHLVASPYWSGPLETVAQLARAQRVAGHDVAVCIDRKRNDAPSEEPAAPQLVESNLLVDVGLELSVKSSPLVMWKDMRRLSKVDVDVLHTHMSHDHVIARWGHPKRAVVIRSIHAPRSIRAGLPRAHGYTVPYHAAQPVLRRSPSIVLPAARPPGFAPAPDREALRRELGLRGSPLIGMISTFQPSRRHLLAFEAMRKLRDVRPQVGMVLVGDGALEPELRLAVRQQTIQDRVHFAGYRRGNDFVRHLQALDEVWILGLGNDWSARAAVQARACDVRVVAVRDGALPEWADALCDPVSDSIVACSVSGNRIPRQLLEPRAVAQEVLALYERARQGRAGAGVS